MGVLGKREKIEIVRVFQDLLGQIGLRRGQSLGEVGDRLTLPPEKVTVHLMIEDGAAPAMFEGHLGIPEAFG